MSQYEQIKQLCQENPDSVDLSFYSTVNINLRSLLASWVEEQNWSTILDKTLDPDCPKSSAESQARDVLAEALTQLRNKAQCDGGIPFVLKHTETSLKTKYESQPLQFVRDIATCLEKERQILLTSMAQRNTQGGSRKTQWITKEQLNLCVQKCEEMTEGIKKILLNAQFVLENWQEDIVSGSDVPRDVFQNGNLIAPPFQTFCRFQKELAQRLDKIVPTLEATMKYLKLHVNQVWKTAQLHACLSRKPEKAEDPGYVEKACEIMCGCIHTLQLIANSTQLQIVEQTVSMPAPSVVVPKPSLKSQLDMSLKTFLHKHLGTLLVVFEQPPLTMMMEKERAARDSDTNNSKKFDTAVGILGGQGFEKDITITAVHIVLCYNHDLAAAYEHNSEPQNTFKIHSDLKADERKASEVSPQTENHIKKYEGVRVEEFSRKDTKHVYRQIYHAVYSVSVKFNMPLWADAFEVQTLSLPILVRTGAVQASEHYGVQLCHSFAAKNVLDPKTNVPSTMKIEDLIQMMNERIRGIGGRGLKQHEKEFMRDKLEMLRGGGKSGKTPKEEVMLEAFIKDPVLLPSALHEKSDKMNFSFWRWFHSIVNLLEQTIKQAWLDNVIYGFASRNHCQEVLKDQPDGTFLLRFSESVVQGNHEKSQGGLGLVGIVEGEIVFAPPIESEHIEKEGLPARIKHIQVNDQMFRFILGTGFDIHFLDKYNKVPEEKEMPFRYLGFSKVELMQMQSKFDGMSVGSPASSVQSHPHLPVDSPCSEMRSGGKRRKRHSDEDSLASQPMSPESADFCAVGVKVQPPTLSSIPAPVQTLLSENGFVSAADTSQTRLQVLDLPALQLGEVGEVGAQVVIEDQAGTISGQDSIIMELTEQDVDFLLNNNASLMGFQPDDPIPITD